MGYKAEEVPVTGVKLDVSNFTLKVDDTKQLEATVMPANASLKAVTWKSGNEKVATVDDNGKVKAIGTGNTTITVTTLDGNKTATCNVAVIRTSGGGGGGSSGGPVVVKDWPDEMEGKPVVSVSDFSGKTFATVTIKTAFVDKVEAVKINGVVANQLVDNKNMWRAEMPEGTTIEALVRKITITLKGPVTGWPDEMEGKPVVSVSDFSGKTFATVTIKTAFVDKVEAVKINGAVANQLVDNKNMWRAEMPEGTTVDYLADKINIILKEEQPPLAAEDVIDMAKTKAQIDVLGVTNVKVTLKDGFGASSVTANNEQAAFLTDKGYWKAALGDPQEGDNVEIIVSLGDGQSVSYMLKVVKL
ncbi:MAG: Ig-like domain-containing protein [Candidatus Syntrophopropionicum ammoniitolerans]